MYLTVVLVAQVLISLNVAATKVSVEQGILQGQKVRTITGDNLYYSYKGIPYAAPPVGSWRFKDAQPALPWEGIRNATTHGNVCPQLNKLKNQLILESEDCLYLNIYTPNLHAEPLLAVMFYIHGGAYAFGSGNDDNYGPDFIMNQNNTVLVTINYRLDTLGFLCLDSEEAPGNGGLKDQVVALRWVNRNIKSFGGDPNKVTIFGQSSGGASAILHAVSPMSKGLFHRAIAMSGVAINEYLVAFEQKRRALVLGKSLGNESDNATSLFEFLQTVPIRQLIDTDSSILATEEIFDFVVKVNYFVPVVEKDYGQERFLIEPPDVSVKNGRVNDVDILLGYVTGEGIALIGLYENSPTIKNYGRYPEALVPRNVFYQITPKISLEISDLIKENYTGSQFVSLNTMPQFVSYVTDIFTYDIIRFARHISKYIKNKIYLYQFSCMSERNIFSKQGAKYGITGVAHFDDLMYLFNENQYNLTVNKNDTSYKMIQQTCSLFTNFAGDGNPTPDLSLGTQWPQYNAKSQIYLDIGEELTLRKKPKNDMIKFWKSVYQKANVPF